MHLRKCPFATKRQVFVSHIEPEAFTVLVNSILIILIDNTLIICFSFISVTI